MYIKKIILPRENLSNKTWAVWSAPHSTLKAGVFTLRAEHSFLLETMGWSTEVFWNIHQSVPWVIVPLSGFLGSLQTLTHSAWPRLLSMTLILASLMPLKWVLHGQCLRGQFLLPAPDVALLPGLQLRSFCALTLRSFPLCPREAQQPSLQWCWPVWDGLLKIVPFDFEVSECHF